MDIKWDYNGSRPGDMVFSITFRGAGFKEHRDAGTAEGSKIALDLEGTARRFGNFRWIPEADHGGGYFAAPRPRTNADARLMARRLVDAFRDQGYDVQAVGAYSAGHVLTRRQTETQSHRAQLAARLEEARYAASREQARADSRAGALSSLRSAARAEEARDILAALKTGDRQAIRLPFPSPVVAAANDYDRRRLIEAHDKKVCYQTEAPRAAFSPS
jgi:hypothetical protein